MPSTWTTALVSMNYGSMFNGNYVYDSFIIGNKTSYINNPNSSSDTELNSINVTGMPTSGDIQTDTAYIYGSKSKLAFYTYGAGGYYASMNTVLFIF